MLERLALAKAWGGLLSQAKEFEMGATEGLILNRMIIRYEDSVIDQVRVGEGLN